MEASLNQPPIPPKPEKETIDLVKPEKKTNMVWEIVFRFLKKVREFCLNISLLNFSKSIYMQKKINYTIKTSYTLKSLIFFSKFEYVEI